MLACACVAVLDFSMPMRTTTTKKPPARSASSRTCTRTWSRMIQQQQQQHQVSVKICDPDREIHKCHLVSCRVLPRVESRRFSLLFFLPLVHSSVSLPFPSSTASHVLVAARDRGLSTTCMEDLPMGWRKFRRAAMLLGTHLFCSSFGCDFVDRCLGW